MARHGVENGSTSDGHGGQDTDDGRAPFVRLQHDEHGEDAAQNAEEASGDL